MVEDFDYKGVMSEVIQYKMLLNLIFTNKHPEIEKYYLHEVSV